MSIATRIPGARVWIMVFLPLVALPMYFAHFCLGQTQPPEGIWTPWRLPPDENPRFFPEGSFAKDRSRMARTFSWYLRSMGEVPLTDSSGRKFAQVYRAVVLPPHGRPALVRLSLETTGDAELVVKVGQSDVNPSTLEVDRTTRLPNSETRSFFSLLDRAEFWSMPTQKPLIRGSRDFKAVMGDTAWMLEGLRTSEDPYHVVDRGVSDGGAFKELMMEFVARLANVDLRSLQRKD